MIDRFGDPERGGFFSTAADHEELIARRKEIGDHPIPSGNCSAAMGLLRLAALSGERRYDERAEAVFRLFADRRAPPPRGLRPPAAGARLPPLPDQRGRPGRRRPHRAGRGRPLPAPPHLVLAGGPEGSGARRAARRAAPASTAGPAAYVCENFTCQLPVTDPQALSDLL